MKNRSVWLVFLFLAASTLFPLAAPAQHDHGAAAEEKPVALYAGMGNLHHPIATSVPDAQRYFDQGLTLIYAFNHAEAARSFRRAAELDPKAAMPLWGVALALGPNYNDPSDPEREKMAYEAIQRAKPLAAPGPEIERGYVDALALRYSIDPNADLKKLARDYSNAMGELSKRYPDDLDAATIYAESMMDLRPWALWNLDGTPAEGTNEIIAVLGSVLARDPNHIGANHYYIHAVEASPHPEWGLASAERLAALVPAGGHIVHMPAHIYARVGDYADAMKTNQAAAAADLNYIEATGVEGAYPAMYYSHNLHFLAYAAAEAGDFTAAEQAASALGENIRRRGAGMPPQMTEAFTNFHTFVLLRFHKWDAILLTPEPVNSTEIVRALWHFARGSALAGLGKPAEAEKERVAFAAVAAKIPAEGRFGFNQSGEVLDIAKSLLDARIAEANGDRKSAIQSLEKAVAVQDGLHYDEPPDWYYPVRESLGGVLLRDGQAAEAEKIFRASLERNPRSGRSLFGLWQSLKAQNNSVEADLVERQFKDAWKSADTALKVGEL